MTTHKFDPRRNAIRKLEIQISDLNISATLATASEITERVRQLDAERTALCVSLIRDVFPDYVVGEYVERDDLSAGGREYVCVTPAGWQIWQCMDGEVPHGTGNTEEEAWMDLYKEWVYSFFSHLTRP